MNLSGGPQIVGDQQDQEGVGKPICGTHAVKNRESQWAIAATLALLLCAAAVLAWLHILAPLYATDVGEQRSLALPDGSTVELNSRTRIRVRFSATERNIDLMEGQALFRVARDLRRPFVVDSDTARVRAVGTEFDVYRKKSGTVVTVLEGRIEVSQADARALTGIPLSAGEEIMVRAHTELRPTRVNAETATAWTRRQLVFKSAPLSSVIEEFNWIWRRLETRGLI